MKKQQGHMSHLSHSHLHHFFQNKELNEFYLSIAIRTFGESLISIFIPIFLYQLGYPIYSIILFYIINAAGFLAFSYPGAKLVSKIGVKHSLLWSTPFFIVYYLGLRFVETHGWLFYVLPLILSMARVLYNYGYHLNFITHSERKERGEEISFIGIITTLMSLIAPLIGGLIAAYYGFTVLYLIGAGILLLAMTPLFWTKDKHEPIDFGIKDLYCESISKKEIGNIISFTGYAMESIIGRIIWPIFLIIILITVQKTGLVVMISMLISVVVFYFAGRITDKYSKLKILKFGTILYFFAWVGRIFANSAFMVLVIDSYKNISEKIVHVPWSAQTYDLAIREGYFKFIVWREIVFNLSRIILMPIILLIFYIGFMPFVISFGIAAMFSIGYIFLNSE
ncbi:MFS transporter [Candidatus Woesearchaeota archaeon]|nr:MFS transporter [Candidatus Woesearchaeota archaeon]MBT6520141.1 MFS transporter [Candidatus Woesearchaeota archaeon]MBT7366746.1 MFS transporter [Candidatus Woesearchaeota archaeon]